MNKKTRIPSEKEMIEIFLGILNKESGREYVQAKEVRFFKKRVDLVQIPKKRDNSFGAAHAIEFKICDWKTGLKQAKRNRILFPYNTLAIWKDFSHRVNKDELETEGIGLIVISHNESDQLLNPKRSPYIDRFHHRRLRKQIIGLSK